MTDPDSEQEVQNAGNQSSSEPATVQPEAAAEPVAMATAAESVHTVSIPQAPVEDV